MRHRRVLLALIACVLVACAALGWIAPHGLVGTTAWAIAAGGVLWGFGAQLERRMRTQLELGEQLMMGAVMWIFASGVLLAAGIASRVPLMVLAAAGFALALSELWRRAREAPAAPSSTAPSPGAITLAVVLALYLAINLLGAVASRGNPFDDHVGYMAFVRRLLDRGDLVEPFSFRRLSAYGGQTALQALLGLRGDIASGDVLDHGVFQIISYLLVLGLARRRRLHLGVTSAIVVFIATLSDLSINSASAWTGLAGFLAAYSLVSDEQRPSRAQLVLCFLVCAATCTLRQSFLVPAGLFAALVLGFELRARARASSWQRAWTEQRVTALLCIAVAAALLLPYMVAAWRSSATFLYPIAIGTANPTVPLHPSDASGLDELGSALAVLFDSEPIHIWWVFAPFMVIARDRRTRRPWLALLVISSIGFALLIHSFQLSDGATTLWRYGWGYLTALVISFLVEAAGRLPFGDPGESVEPALRLPAIAIVLIWLAVFAQIVQIRLTPEHRLVQLVDDIKAARVLGTGKPADQRLYHDAQAALPAGARTVILVDDPYLLDYRRNDFVNLDLPGFAGPRGGIPSFLGPERWRSYFVSQGLRYVMFVDGIHSTYLFRRRPWLLRIFNETELFRYMGTRMVDALDTFAALARSSRVLFDRGGLVVIDLGEHAAPPPVQPDPPEPLRQDRFVQQLSENELHNTAWQLASRSDVSFQIDGNGPSPVEIELRDRLDDAMDAVGGLLGVKVPPPPPPHRWLSDRTHLRVLGHGEHWLRMKLRVDATRLATFPSASLWLDGKQLDRASAGRDGMIAFDTRVTCTGWCDVYLVFSTVSEYWAPADLVRVIKLLELEWIPAT